MEKITGKNNDLIKSVKKMLISSKERRMQNAFVLEGARLVFDALNSFYAIRYFLITDSAYEKYRDSAERMAESAEKSYFISEDIASKLSDTQSSQGVFAVCEMRQSEFELNKNDKLIALDNVQDFESRAALCKCLHESGPCSKSGKVL